MASRHAGERSAASSGSVPASTSLRNSMVPSSATTADARSGRRAASSTATAPPALWPTSNAPRTPRWSQSAATSAACAGIASRSPAASGPGTSLSPWPAASIATTR